MDEGGVRLTATSPHRASLTGQVHDNVDETPYTLTK